MKLFLVLEDEPFIAMDLQYAFEDAGYEAVTAVGNEEAIAHIEESDIVGAILDVSLGGGVTCQATATRLAKEGVRVLMVIVFTEEDVLAGQQILDVLFAEHRDAQREHLVKFRPHGVCPRDDVVCLWGRRGDNLPSLGTDPCLELLVCARYEGAHERECLSCDLDLVAHRAFLRVVRNEA